MSITRVAERAGVSTATVSRVINNDPVVAPATVTLVRDCMRELGYVPRALRPGPKRAERRNVRSGTVLLLSLLSQSPVEMYRMPAFPSLLGGAQEALSERGLNLLLAHCPDGVAVPPALATGKVDGVVLVGRAPTLGARLHKRLSVVPTVWVFRDHNDPEREFDHVLYDNREVGALAARYLQGRGHVRVAYVSTSPIHPAYLQRREQFCVVGAALGLQVTVHESPQPLELNEQVPYVEGVLQQLLAAPQRVTAIFCPADDRLWTVHHLLQRLGVPLGRDLELLGCNNDPAYMGMMHPRPATIDIRLEQVGRKAAELLWQRLGEHTRTETMEVLIKPTIAPGDLP